jgi:membrane protein
MQPAVHRYAYAGAAIALSFSAMTEGPIERPPNWRSRWVGKLIGAKDMTWSWLTDPAVLVYRRHGFGQKRVRATIVESALFLREIIREFWTNEGTSRAASLAYTTLLSLIPLLVAFTTYVKRYFTTLFPGFYAQIDVMLNAVMPYRSPQITYHVARFTENAATASMFGAIAFMFVAFRLFLAVEGAINQIWKVRSVRGYRQKIIAFTMLFFWGPLLMTLSFTTTSMLERNRYLRVLLQGDLIFMVVPVVVLFIGFTMLFWLVPSARVRLPAAMIGAVVTTGLFSLVRYLFGIYAAHLVSGRFNFIYGAVGLALIFLISIEVMWLVILLGVQISYVWQNLYGVLRATEQQVEDQPQFDLYFALRGLLEVSRRFDRREQPPSAYRLAEQFGVTDSQMTRVMRKLEDGKLVAQTGGEWIGFVPACDPDRISIEEVIARMEGMLRLVPDIGPDDRERQAVGGLFSRLNSCTSAALDRMSIGRLVRELYAPREVRETDVV